MFPALMRQSLLLAGAVLLPAAAPAIQAQTGAGEAEPEQALYFLVGADGAGVHDMRLRPGDGDQEVALDALRPIRGLSEGRQEYLNLADLAGAVGGAWGRDPLSRDPLFTLAGNRVLFSSDDRRIAVNGRRRRLARPPEFRGDGIYASADFLDVISELLETELELTTIAPDMPAPRPGMAEGGTNDPSPPGWDEQDGDDLEDDGFYSNQPRPRPTRVRTIVIDPGHGGEEEGAKGPTDLLEKEVALEISRRLRQRLERRGYEVHLTRNGDFNLPLEERTAIANNRQADIFLSVHANSSPSREARGAETYYLSLSRAEMEGFAHEGSAFMDRSTRKGEDPLKMVLWDMAQSARLTESSHLAETVQSEFNRLLDIPDRGVKQAPLRVLVGATMPAVLVEVGFISNPEEEERLRDEGFQDRIVEALVRSVDSYRRQMRMRGRRRDVGWEPGASQ